MGFIPAADPAQLMIAAAAKRRGETLSQPACLPAAVALAVATVPSPRWSLASPAQRWLVPGPAGRIARGLVPAEAARAPVGAAVAWCGALASAWHAGLACGMLGAGSWEPPPFRCSTLSLSWRRP